MNLIVIKKHFVKSLKVQKEYESKKTKVVSHVKKPKKGGRPVLSEEQKADKKRKRIENSP